MRYFFTPVVLSASVATSALILSILKLFGWNLSEKLNTKRITCHVISTWVSFSWRFVPLDQIRWKETKQDGRLAPAYFSPNYKNFDQFLQTVKNKTTVLILVFKEFLQINSTADFCTLCKRVSLFSVEKFCLTVPKNFVEEPVCVSENFGYRKTLPKRGISRFCIENLLSHSTEKLRRGTLLCFTKFLVSRNFLDKRGEEGGREYHDFLSKNFCLTVPKFFVGEPLVFH